MASKRLKRTAGKGEEVPSSPPGAARQIPKWEGGGRGQAAGVPGGLWGDVSKGYQEKHPVKWLVMAAGSLVWRKENSEGRVSLCRWILSPVQKGLFGRPGPMVRDASLSQWPARPFQCALQSPRQQVRGSVSCNDP